MNLRFQNLGVEAVFSSIFAREWPLGWEIKAAFAALAQPISVIAVHNDRPGIPVPLMAILEVEAQRVTVSGDSGVIFDAIRGDYRGIPFVVASLCEYLTPKTAVVYVGRDAAYKFLNAIASKSDLN